MRELAVHGGQGQDDLQGGRGGEHHHSLCHHLHLAGARHQLAVVLAVECHVGEEGRRLTRSHRSGVGRHGDAPAPEHLTRRGDVLEVHLNAQVPFVHPPAVGDDALSGGLQGPVHRAHQCVPGGEIAGDRRRQHGDDHRHRGNQDEAAPEGHGSRST
jgi:hypothetical protein